MYELIEVNWNRCSPKGEQYPKDFLIALLYAYRQESARRVTGTIV